MRHAIDQAGLAPWEAKGIAFPRGACGHASGLLAYRLHTLFGIAPDLVCQDAEIDIGGWLGGHAWLEWGGLTIDISGDQFGWDKVIVTRFPIFHGRGTDQNRGPALADRTWWVLECRTLWNAIMPFLDHCT